MINEVKLIFFSFSYPINAPVDFDNILQMRDLLTLAAMKASALGGRMK